MGPTFFGRVDVGILDSPMGPLGLPGLISQFTLFTSKSNVSEFKEPDEFQPDHLRVQQQLLDDETRALQVTKLVAL